MKELFSFLEAASQSDNNCAPLEAEQEQFTEPGVPQSLYNLMNSMHQHAGRGKIAKE